MVSVIVPLYNKEKTIKQALESVLSQSYDDWEIVVVDDGSSDASEDAVLSMKHPLIRLISQGNAGVSAARNRGIREAKGEFVAFLDSDDEWRPEYLDSMVRLVEKYPQCDVFVSNYEFHKADGRIEKTIINKLPFDGEEGELTNYFEVASCGHPPMWTSAVMVRKSAIEAVGGFPTGIRSGEDLLAWARLAEKFRIAYSRRPLAYFNVQGYDNRERPKREPQTPDVVGAELAKIDAPHIRRYRAHWHRMRANIYMRLRQRRNSLKECRRSLALNPLNHRVWAIAAVNLLPAPLQPF